MAPQARVIRAAVWLALVAGAAISAAAAPAARVLLISVDGLRPDLISDATTPVIRALMRRGSYTREAVTVAEGYTLPSHISMLTGVPPDRHGVTWNRHIEDAYPEVPTVFELARRAGLTTAMAAGKTKFIVLTRPGDLNWQFLGYEERDTDADVAAKAVAMFREHDPVLMFAHLGDVDLAGHTHGWGSPEQRSAIAGADAAVGHLLEAMAPVSDSTLVLVTADHGGEGRGHEPGTALSRQIPWIAAGPGVRANYDLGAAGVAVDTRDTFATVCHVLGIRVPHVVDGRVVAEMFTSR